MLDIGQKNDIRKLSALIGEVFLIDVIDLAMFRNLSHYRRRKSQLGVFQTISPVHGIFVIYCVTVQV